MSKIIYLVLWMNEICGKKRKKAKSENLREIRKSLNGNVNVAKSYNLLKKCVCMCVCVRSFIWCDLKIQSTARKSIVPSEEEKKSVTASIYLNNYCLKKGFASFILCVRYESEEKTLN